MSVFAGADAGYEADLHACNKIPVLYNVSEWEGNFLAGPVTDELTPLPPNQPRISSLAPEPSRSRRSRTQSAGIQEVRDTAVRTATPGILCDFLCYTQQTRIVLSSNMPITAVCDTVYWVPCLKPTAENSLIVCLVLPSTFLDQADFPPDLVCVSRIQFESGVV